MWSLRDRPYVALVSAMPTKRRELFATVRTEGAILPADLLQRITVFQLQDEHRHLATDPLALLESLRSYARTRTVICQGRQIYRQSLLGLASPTRPDLSGPTR